MSGLFKSKRRAALAIGAVFLAVTLVCASVAWVFMGEGDFADRFAAIGAMASQLGQDDDYAYPELEVDELPDLPEFPLIAQVPEQLAPRPTLHFPQNMRGVYLVPGHDFLTNLDATPEEIKAEVDDALSSALELTMNTVIIGTAHEGEVIFNTADATGVGLGFDLMTYITIRARQLGLYTYAIFDASHFADTTELDTLSINPGSIGRLAENLREFTERYDLDGILLDGYTRAVTDTGAELNSYLVSGGAIGFENYLRGSPAAVVSTVSQVVRSYAPGVKIGLLADPVWENDSENPYGSATSAAFTALSTGNADTKAFVQQGAVDFIAVEAFASLTDSNAPFEEVVRWWGELARSQGMPLYVVHASSNIQSQSAGWASPDQLAQQVIRASEISGFSGSIFNSLGSLVENQDGAGAVLVGYYQGEVETQHILTELTMVSPAQTTFTTNEPMVRFSGASDPNFPLTVNGNAITTTDANGYFTINMELSAGLNTFTFEHKARTITYNITRNIEILREASPTGNIAIDGNMQLTISAVAYQNATVSARINGVNVSMTVDEAAQDEAMRVSHFRRFTGTFTTPAGTASEQNLGAITVTAAAHGHSESRTGATVRVNRRVPVSDGVPVVVTAAQARTYPPNTLNNIPSANFFPLPRGAMDYAVGDEITYTSRRGNTYRYRVLASGLRVASGDIQATDNFVAENTIHGLTVSTQGRFTYVTVNTAQQVTYSVRYTGSQFVVQFAHTASVPSGTTQLDSNPMFSSVSWSGGDTMTLTLVRNGGFMGYRAYYDANGNLAFRFNTPPASLSGARIAIDIGHGGNDPGALGFLTAYPEAVINRRVADNLAQELRARGASVLLIDNSSNPSLQNRVAQAENFEADIFVSVHHNASTNSASRGTETFYFYSYGATTASAISRHVSAALGTTNRGARQSFYHITLSAQFQSVLVEGGFMTNPSEYEKLIQPHYQRAIAVGIANGLADGIAAAHTGRSATGSQTVGNGPGGPAGGGTPPPSDSNDNDTQDEDNSTQDNEPDNETEDDDPEDDEQLDDSITLYFLEDFHFLLEGESLDLEFVAEPNPAGATFSSSNTAVATVDQNGRVEGHSEGTAVITITLGGARATTTVEVFQP
ncbi:MAG: N-acetylmuramoyl-L-alanine amidase [Oscillospiraceae bacterium]|nr:N-acetylmuramoyl-L-alanine amidase [Oscillospiraceae bacterium]